MTERSVTEGPLDACHFEALARPAIRGLPVYDPGHDLVGLRERAGAEALVELGSAENPYGASPRVRDALLAQLDRLHRYPDPRGSRLKRALAAAHAVDPGQIMLGNGSHELLMQLCQVFAGEGDEVVFSQYGFAVFHLAARASGATPRAVDALSLSGPMPLGHDLDAMADAITPATRLVYLANPNNPTGTWFGQAALEAFMSRIPASVIVVMDEAYAGLGTPGSDIASAQPLLERHANLVMTRTFSKAHGLAGLRIGYLVGAAGLVEVMERVRESFNVNALALVAAETSLADATHLQSVRDRNEAQRSALAEALAGLGIDVLPSQTNFLLARIGPGTAAVEQALTLRNIVLRPMAGYGLPDWLRITVGTRQENERLLAALDEVRT